jgi:hypothetical protein
MSFTGLTVAASLGAAMAAPRILVTETRKITSIPTTVRRPAQLNVATVAITAI